MRDFLGHCLHFLLPFVTMASALGFVEFVPDRPDLGLTSGDASAANDDLVFGLLEPQLATVDELCEGKEPMYPLEELKVAVCNNGAVVRVPCCNCSDECFKCTYPVVRVSSACPRYCGCACSSSLRKWVAFEPIPRKWRR